MSRETRLLKNTGIIAIGQLSSKLLSFLLLPLYTNLLLPDDYGVVDVLQTVISLILYFATLQLESAVFRFIIEKRGDEKEKSIVISSAFIVIVISNIVFSTIVIAINLFLSIPHILPFILSFWGLSFSAVMLNVSRGNGNNVLYSVSSFCITMSFLLINIVLIIFFKIGAVSILWAISISNFIGAAVVFAGEKDFKHIKFRYFNSSIIKNMLGYSLPLIPNAISWWVANASDRFIIAMFLGSTYNGIYAAANKIPTIYLTLFNVFNLAWTEAVIVNIKDEDSKNFINGVFTNSLKLFSSLCVILIGIIGIVFDLIIGEKYDGAYNHILILIIAIYVNSLCSMYGGIFSGYKDSKATSISTVFGAITNIIVNLVSVRLISLYAASLSTLISYIVILMFRHELSKKHLEIKWPVGFMIRFAIILLIDSISYISRNIVIVFMTFIIILIWGLLENKGIIVVLITSMKNRLKDYI